MTSQDFEWDIWQLFGAERHRQALDVCTDRCLMMIEAEQLFWSLQRHVLPGLYILL